MVLVTFVPAGVVAVVPVGASDMAGAADVSVNVLLVPAARQPVTVIVSPAFGAVACWPCAGWPCWPACAGCDAGWAEALAAVTRVTAKAHVSCFMFIPPPFA